MYSNQPLRHKQRSYKEEKKQQLEKGINTGKKINTYIYKIKQQIIEKLKKLITKRNFYYNTKIKKFFQNFFFRFDSFLNTRK